MPFMNLDDEPAQEQSTPRNEKTSKASPGNLAMRDLVSEAKMLFDRLEKTSAFNGTHGGTNGKTGDQMRAWLIRAREALGHD